MAAILSSNASHNRPDDRLIAPLISEQYGVSAQLALALAAGALSRRIDALALARQYKLISIDTSEARQKGLLQ